MANLKKKAPAKKVTSKIASPASPAGGPAIRRRGGKTAVRVVPKTKAALEVRGLTATVVGVDGKAKGKMTIPPGVFDQPINKQLINQAVRVYLANQRVGGANTKTRGEVEGSTRKIYRQKGTGRARHGSIRAHIFVGGGIVFGPVTHDFSLTMPTKMKRKALASALSQQYKAGNVVIIDGLEGLAPKTKFMAKALAPSMSDTGSILLVLASDAPQVALSARNIKGVDMLPATSMNTYDVLSHKKVVFMKHAVSMVVDTVTKVA